MKARATCYVCSGPFEYIKLTKPRRYCSGACEYHGIRRLANARRARLRAALKRHTGHEHPLHTTNVVSRVTG